MNPTQLLKHFDRIAEAPDAVTRLRRFLLYLAVRGRLVEQDPEDEPASELLKRIRAGQEKLGLAAKWKLPDVEEIRDHEKPFELPTGWEWARLVELTAVLNGRAYKKTELLDSGTPVLRVGNLFTSKHWYYSDLILDEDKYCDEGDLIFSWSASFGPFIWPGPKVIYHYHIWKLRLHSETNLDKNYLYRFLLQKTQEIKESGHGISMIHMTKKKMEKVVVPLPPLPEQRSIVAKVHELMALCDELEAAQTERETRRDRFVTASLHRIQNPDEFAAKRKGDKRAGKTSKGSMTVWHDLDFLGNLPRLTTRAEHIKQLRQTILNLAVRGRLILQDPKDESVDKLLERIEIEKEKYVAEGLVKKWPALPEVLPSDASFKIPAWWTWVRLGNISHVLMGQSPPGSTYNKTGDGVPLINGPVEFTEGPFGKTVINQYTSAPTKLCQKGDLLLCVRGSTTGRTNIAGFQACIGRGVAAIRPLFADNYVRLFIWSIRESIINMGRGIAFPSVSRKQVEELPVPLPPLAEQYRIVAKVDELMALCDQLDSQLTTTQSDSRRLLEAVLQEAI